MEQKTKKLKLFDLVSIGVGSVIGAGIFSMLGTGVAITGRSVSLALVFAMIIVFVQNVRGLFLANMFHLEGGMYAQSAIILPKWMTGVSAAVLLISNLSFSVYGISIASYLAQLLPALAPFQTIVAVIITTLAFASTIKGSKFMAKIQNVMVMLMYLALGLFVVFGLMKSDSSAYAGEPYFISGTNGFLMAIAVMSFTCNGATNVLNLGEDAEKPKKNIPLAVVLTTLVCSAIYFIIGYAATASLSYGEIAGQNLGFIAERIMPQSLYLFFVIGGAIFALLTSLMGGIAGMRYPIVSSAEDGWFPKVFAKKTKDGFPYMVVLTMYIIAIVPIFGNFSLDSIVSFVLVPGAFTSLVGNFLCIGLPKKFPEQWKNKSFKISAGMFAVVMVVSSVANIFVAGFSLMNLDRAGMIGNIAMTVALFAYGYIRSRSSSVKINSLEGIKKDSEALKKEEVNT